MIQRLRKLYSKGEFSAAGRHADKMLRNLPEGAALDLRDDAMLTGVFAYAKAGEFERGWQLAQARTTRQADYLDFCYALCYLAYQRADYDETEAWGSRYLERHAQSTEESAYANTRDKIHEVLNTLGCAAKDRGQDTHALEYFDRCIQTAPDYPLSYLNATLVSQRAGHKEKAQGYIQDGLSRCGEVDELRMLERGLLGNRRISLCMIVKDEEEMLPAALDSVKGIVDEMLIVDTGSKDRTVEIAESYGARVYHHAWENNFSKSRNQSIAYATGDWVLILDADERLDAKSAPLVRNLAQTCPHEAVSFSVYNVDLDTDHVSFLPSIRMFRNGRGYGYEGIVHNQINIPRDTAVMRAPVRIDHFGYTPSIADKRKKFERTTALLRQQLEANPDDAFAHFNMAQIMRGGEAGKRYAPEIIVHARRVIELISTDDQSHLHILLMGYHQLASSHFVLDQYDEAEKACRDALAIKPDFIDCLMTLGHTLSVKKRYDDAREAFFMYLRVREKYNEAEESTGYILLNLHTQHQAHYGLGLIEEALGRHVLALEWYGKVLAAKDDYLETHLRIGQICYKIGRVAEARTAFQNELRFRPDSFWAHYCLGDLAAQESDWPQAYHRYQRAHELNLKHPNLSLNLATTALKNGRAREAKTWLAQVRPELAREPKVMRLAAEIEFELGEYAAARDQYMAYLNAHPNDSGAWSDLGNAHFKMDELHAAKTCYERALQCDPEFQLARRNLALVFLRLQQYAEARSQLALYLDSGSADPDAVFLFADLLAAQGEHQSALTFYENYLVKRPQDDRALFRLAQSYHAMGQEGAAAMGYRHVLQRNPDFTPAKEALAELGIVPQS
jgi:tetratricopeptide (TPR) repeat protein